MNSSCLSMVEGKLPAGFRFHPRDDELICDYLMNKLLIISSPSTTLLLEVDLNKCEPWDLPERACVGGKEWYFYSRRDRKYATGLRTNRATVSGYWKATGKDRAVLREGSLVGMRKTLVFYQGRAPKGSKTDWVMHEFRLEGPFGPPKLSSSKEDWGLCRVFHKSRESLPPKPNQINGHDETGCCSSSLPDLMDSFISFDQTCMNDEDDHDDDDGGRKGVPCCFSKPNSPLFHVEPNQPCMTIGGGPYHAPAYGNNQLHDQDGLVFAGSASGVDVAAAVPSGSTVVEEACDRHVIEAVLSHLITNNVKDSTTTTSSPSPPAVSIAAAGISKHGSEISYLSDVGYPTMSMWPSHY